MCIGNNKHQKKLKTRIMIRIINNDNNNQNHNNNNQNHNNSNNHNNNIMRKIYGNHDAFLHLPTTCKSNWNRISHILYESVRSSSGSL